MLFSFGALMIKHSSTPCSTTMEKEADTPTSNWLQNTAAKRNIGAGIWRKQNLCID